MLTEDSIKKVVEEAVRNALTTGIGSRLDQMEERLLQLEQNLEEERNKNSYLFHKTVQLEGHNRRSNLIVKGMDKSAQGREDDETFFKKMCQHYGLPTGEIERCHWLGPSQVFIVKFLRFKDKQGVMKARGKLRGSRIYLEDDYPRYTREKRDRLRQLAIPIARARNERAFITFPFDYARIGNEKIFLTDLEKNSGAKQPQGKTAGVAEQHKGTKGKPAGVSSVVRNTPTKVPPPTPGSKRNDVSPIDSSIFGKRAKTRLQEFEYGEGEDDPFQPSSALVRSPLPVGSQERA